MKWRSLWHSPAPTVRNRTSPGAGSSTRISSISNAPGCWFSTAAFIRSPSSVTPAADPP